MELDKEVRQKEKFYRMGIYQVGLFHPLGEEPNFYYYVNPLKGKRKSKVVKVKRISEKNWVSLNYQSFQQMDNSSQVSEEISNQTESISQLGSIKQLESERFISNNNVFFRFFIWRDMFEDWKVHKPIMGVDFGKPLRSPSLEVLHWGESEWGRDGWIEPHNSFFNILYRAGIVGIILVVLAWGALVWFIRLAFVRRSWVLILLAAILLNWMVAANFLLILELPYTAIPFWTLAGMAGAYAIKR
jgi:hypothetical protein